jgi:hypothetical protein
MGKMREYWMGRAADMFPRWNDEMRERWVAARLKAPGMAALYQSIATPQRNCMASEADRGCVSACAARGKFYLYSRTHQAFIGNAMTKSRTRDLCAAQAFGSYGEAQGWESLIKNSTGFDVHIMNSDQAGAVIFL